MDDYAPDRILIEPSGVGKLSDVAKAVERVEGAHIGAKVTVVDAGKAKMYMRNFGEFFNDQVSNADLIVLSRTDTANSAKVLTAVELLKGLNDHAGLITTPWDALDGRLILEAMDENGLKAEMEKLRQEHEHHHHHDHDEDEEHEHHHHHDHDDGEECDDPECECHHHHDHDEDEEHEHHHHHHHDDGEECDDPDCECHHHHDHDEDEEHEHHHHHHHADEVFASWGMETPKKFTEAGLREILEQLGDAVQFGIVLRAKGIVDAADGDWLYFDYVPGEMEIRRGAPAVTGRFCVIGSHIRQDALKELFTGE
jgi:G3E family GTPase